MSARLLDETIYLGKPQARALTDFLSGVERLERFGYDFGRHSNPGVGHEYSDILTGLDFVVHTRIGFVDMRVGRLDGQFATFGHRVASIECKVYKCVLKLITVSESRPKPPCQYGFDKDCFADRPSQ